MMRRTHRLSALVLAAALAVGACGGNDDPSSVHADIDISALDSGNYPTTPIDIEKARTVDSGAIRESIAIGAAMPLLMDIDNRFIYNSRSASSRMVTPAVPPDFYIATGIDTKEFNAIVPGVVAGWYTFGQRREDMSIGRSAELYAVRFTNVDTASAASRILGDRTTGTDYRLPDYPGAISRVRDKIDYRSATMNSWLAHGDMLLHLRIEDPLSVPFDPVPLAELTKRAFDKQIDMLKNYTPTPLDKIAAQPLDVDGLLSRVPTFAKEHLPVNGANPWGVYPLRSTVHSESHPDIARAAYEDAGMDYLVVGEKVIIYRTRDSSSTTRLTAAMQEQVADKETYKKTDSPPNFPSAQCFEVKPGVSSAYQYHPVCWFSIDRHVAQVHGRNVQDVHQRTAAQYKLLVAGH
ncbi:hypothetical protein [Nocardia sp. NPDC050710]|uniref:DUF7373 family lipoprotein n=1 Tax=Nocardia sp. NPDC050710 TaxID=3157220 RepID=UPI0033E7455C